MRRFSKLVVGGALIAFPAVADESTYSAFLEADSLTWSDSFPIDAFLNNFETGSFESGGETSFTHNQITVGAERGGFRAGLTTRYDYYTEYTPDTARLVFDSSNDGVQAGDYDLFVDLKEVQASGLQVGYAHAVSDALTIEARVSALTLHRLTDGDAFGAISIDANDEVSGAAEGDYSFTDNLLFSEEFPAPGGVGATADILVHWSPREKLKIRAAAYDIASYLKWDDVPRTEFIADTATAIREESGQLVVNPTLSGRDSQSDYLQRYFARYEIDTAYEVGKKAAIGLNIVNIEKATLAEMRASYAITNDLRVGAQYEWQSGGVGVSLNWKGLDVQLSADSFDHEKAVYARAKVGWRMHF